MSRLVWVSAVLVPVVVAALALPWALADFLLDRFGSLRDSLMRGHSNPERRESPVDSA